LAKCTQNDATKSGSGGQFLAQAVKSTSCNFNSGQVAEVGQTWASL